MTSSPTLSFALVALSLFLAGCETTSTPTEAAKPAEPPMTRSRAATECWMKTEKGSAGADLDKRADIVNKCIDEKLKADEKMRAAPAAAPAAQPAPAPPAPKT